MGWGHKAIEIRSAETGHLDGVFMHKRTQRLRFLCERNDKVRLLRIVRYRYSLSSSGIFLFYSKLLFLSNLLYDTQQNQLVDIRFVERL